MITKMPMGSNNFFANANQDSDEFSDTESNYEEQPPEDFSE
jgi:hypothetical protein